MTALKTLAAAFTLVLAGTAVAQTPPAGTPPPPAKPRGLKSLDTNKDGLLSRDEVKSRHMLSKKFDAIDTNKDGQLSKEELRVFRAGNKTRPR